ncbi:P-loop containing nucleoside triphosphate hydrolase protein [Aspergillus floccosus]
MIRQEFLGLSSQEPRRVISFPASQSLHASTASTLGAISTGIPRLDEAICPGSADETAASDSVPATKGIPRGHVTEVFGPPGVGKTFLALSLVCNALQEEGPGKVVWIDTGSPLPRPRLREMLLKSIDTKSSQKTPEDLANNLVYLRAPTLPHLLALILHPPQDFPPDETKLLIIDSASALFPPYFPNPSELRARLAQSRVNDKAQINWLTNRKWNVVSELASSLVRLATTRRLAILAVNQAHTKIRGHPRATLCPVLAGGAWEASVYTRLVLYWDFLMGDGDADGAPRAVRFAEVTKRAGRLLAVRAEENIVPFRVGSDGLYALDEAPNPCAVAEEPVDVPSASQRKRKVEEIADSQDEDSDGEFGWTEGDDAGLLEGNE